MTDTMTSQLEEIKMIHGVNASKAIRNALSIYLDYLRQVDEKHKEELFRGSKNLSG